MSRIFLIRHGEVEGNSGERLTFAGWNDVPLTARGERQAEAVARRLEHENLRAVYSSDLQRARRTAELIAAAHSLEVQTDAALREVDYGAWTGLSETEVVAGWGELWRRRQRDPENVAAPDGESYADLWRRLQPAWERIAAQSLQSGGDMVTVGHNGTIRILLCHLLGMPPANYRRIGVSNCGLSCVELASGRGAATAARPAPVVRFINEGCHLREI